MRKISKQIDQALDRRPVTMMCYATAAASFVAVACGSLINYAVAEVVPVGGLLIASLFFLGLGLVHRNDTSEQAAGEVAPQAITDGTPRVDAPERRPSEAFSRPAAFTGTAGGPEQGSNDEDGARVGAVIDARVGVEVG